MKKILAELYKLEPELKKHEEDLKILIEELIKAKPDTKFDKAFAKKLKTQLSSYNQSPSNQNRMQKLLYVFSGVALCALIVAGFGYFKPGSLDFSNKLAYENQEESSSLPQPENIVFQRKIAKVADNAFGDLGQIVNNSGNAGLGAGGAGATNEIIQNEPGLTEEFVATDSDEATPNNAEAKTVPTVEVEEYGIGGGGVESSIAPYQPTKYVYNYIGEDLDLSRETVEVLKRIKNEDSQISVTKLLKNFNFDVADLSKFKDTKLENLSFSEDRSYGYSVYIDFRNENISINENWSKWDPCYYPECEPKMFDKNSLPSDEKIIALSDEFLAEYSIDTTNYGEPEIQKYWEQYPEENQGYLPEYITVLYPLIVKDKPVYHEGGSKNGLNTTVNINKMKASGVWDLNSQTYESSSYPAETDAKKILENAKKGGFNWYWYHYPEEKAKVVELELDTPQEVYLKIWNYEDNTNEELLIPALLFPITEESKNNVDPYFYRENVIVPLVEDILDAEDSTPYGPIRAL